MNNAPQNPEPGVQDSTVARNLAEIRARIAEAAHQHGRAASEITLVAVSKMHPIAAVRAALRAGQTIFGENRVQEAAEKFPALRPDYPALRLHLIGGLQTNKARDALRLADVVESLDRPRLADALAAELERAGQPPSATEFLIEVNVGEEAQKAGIGRAQADDFITACQDRFGARLQGLMCVPPVGEDPRPHFTWLAECAARHRLARLSMGMSVDFAAAIGCGATHVRIGTAIFGSR
jgi:pyridoxal phosphate enzyme (YggS family)